jgi:hypothetical protein
MNDELINRLSTRSLSLRKRAAKERESYISSRQLRGIADLLDETVMFLEGARVGERQTEPHDLD